MKKIVLAVLCLLVVSMFLVGCGTGEAIKTGSESEVEVLQNKINLYEDCDILTTRKSVCQLGKCGVGVGGDIDGTEMFYSDINGHQFGLNSSNMLPNEGKTYFDYGFSPWTIAPEKVIVNKGQSHQFSDGMKLTLLNVWFDAENYANVRICMDYEPIRLKAAEPLKARTAVKTR